MTRHRHALLGRLTIPAMVVISVLLAPLAYAQFPDETYLGGLWDGGDNDDAILLVQSTLATVEPSPFCRTEPVLVVVPCSRAWTPSSTGKSERARGTIA